MTLRLSISVSKLVISTLFLHGIYKFLVDKFETYELLRFILVFESLSECSHLTTNELDLITLRGLYEQI